MRDDDVRSSLFASLDVLSAKHGPEVPYRGGLDAGFAFRGVRVPFLNFQKGIYCAAAQRGLAALSLNTSYRSPYDDEEAPDGFAYAYRTGPIDQPDKPGSAHGLWHAGPACLLRWHATWVVPAGVADLRYGGRPRRPAGDADSGTDGRTL
jgi:hypothetical protein